MAATSNVVKKTARSALKDNWLEAIAIGSVMLFSVFVIYIAVSFLSMALPEIAVYAVLIALMIFILSPLMLGALKCYWLIMWDKKGVLNEIFYYFSCFKNYLKAIKLFLSLCFKAVWVGALLLIPSVITDVLSSAKIYELFQFSAPAWASNLWVVSIFLKVAAAVALIAIMVKYYLAPFLIIADEQMDIHEAIHKSTLLSRATGIDFVLLIFSFFGWFLLSVLVIPLLVTIPYFMVSYMVHSRFSVANYNKVIAQMGADVQYSNFINEGF